VYAAFTARGTTLLTACLPDPGAMLGLPAALARPLARRQRAVNAVVHALSDRYGAIHLHASEGVWLTDRALWSADRLHPGERGHRQLAVRFHALLTEAGLATGEPPSPEPEFPAPTRAASLVWLATAGTGWVVRRCTDLLPQLLRLAADELRHRARGTSSRLDLRAAASVSSALAALAAAERPAALVAAERRDALVVAEGPHAFVVADGPHALVVAEGPDVPVVAEGPHVPGAGAEAQRRRTETNLTGVPGTACAAAGRSAVRTTAITG
jgi:hypothetical protein